MLKRILIISPHFPPVNAPDLHRVRMSLPRWDELGIDVTVLSATPEPDSQAIESELVDTLPSSSKVIRLKPISKKRTEPFGLRNLGWRLYRALAREGDHQLRTHNFDLVYFSTTQFACLPLARRWHKKYRVPYVIDLQDPWVNTYYKRHGIRPPGGWKFPVSQALAKFHESRSFRHCAGVLSVSPTYLADLRERYCWFAAKAQKVLPFGYSQRDLDHLASSKKNPNKSGALQLVYTGRLGDDMQDHLALMLKGITAYHTSESTRKVELHCQGASYSPNPKYDYAPPAPLPDGVQITPSRIGFYDSLRLQAEADALLLLGSSDSAYSPSKIHFLLAQKKPLLAIVEPQTVLAYHLSGYPQVCLAAPSEGESGVQKVVAFLKKPEAFQADDRMKTMLQKFEADTLADAQLEFFKNALKDRP